MAVYLDHAAASPPSRAALSAFLRVSRQYWQNPASLHAAGEAAGEVLNTARSDIARVLKSEPDEICWVSGGTEANNLALKAAADIHGRRNKHIVSTTLEHPSVLETLTFLRARGYETTLVAPGKDGVLRTETLLAACREDTFLMSVCAVCAETGALAPLETLGTALKEQYPHILLHSDAVQGFLRRPLYPASLRIDLMTLSGHKIGAPKGIGALYIRRGVRLRPEIHGGGQENGLRSGTANAPLCAAFAAAVTHFTPAAPELRHYAADILAQAGASLLPLPAAAAAPHILCFAMKNPLFDRYWPAQVLQRMLSERGVYLSAGSACKRGKRGPALNGMVLPSGMADGLVRASFSAATTQDDIQTLRRALTDITEDR